MKGILCSIGFVLCGLSAVAQVGSKEGTGSGAGQLWGIQEFMEKMVEEGSGDEWEELEGYFLYRIRHPLDINSASREELEGLHLLTDFQIASLLEYRSRSGHVLSRTELQLVNGFDAASVSLIAPLITFGQGDSSEDDTYFAGRRGRDTLAWYRKAMAELYVKWWWKESSEEWLGPDFYSQIKFKGDYNNRLRIGFTAEKDAGEMLFPGMLGGGAAGGGNAGPGGKAVPAVDFLSGYIMANDVRLGGKMKVSDFVVGDYAVRLGQGLVLWNGTSFGAGSSVQGVYKKGAQLNPYTSSDENDFMRGAGATLRRNFSVGKGIGLTAFFSLKDVDARIKDGKYTSLKTDGLHNTGSTLQTRKTLGEIVYGGSVQYWNHKIKVGLNWAGYGYDAHNGRTVQEYNKYQMYDGQWGNFSIDLNAIWGGRRIFLETACDYGGSMALLGGMTFRRRGWDCAATFRSYSRSYIAPYAGAYSTISSCSNQNGMHLVAQKNIGWGMKLSLGGDVVHYPWVRYGVPEESGAVKLWCRVERQNGPLGWNVKLYGSADTYETSFKCGVKGYLCYDAASWLQVKVRGEAVTVEGDSWGAAAGAELVATAMRGRFRGVLHGAYYNCKEWNCRLYMYEYDLPLTYSSRLQYGEGAAAYALLSYKMGQLGTLYIKGDTSQKVKVGLKMRFF